MIELSREQYFMAAPIFSELSHDRAIIFSVLEGSNPGRVFVNDPLTPTVALVYPQSAFIYLGGELVDMSVAHEAIDLIRDVLLPAAGEREAIIFTCSDSWNTELTPILAALGAFTIYRKTFSFDAVAFEQHTSWANLIPQGMTMRRIDHELAQRTGVVGTWSSVDDFVSKGFGFCLTEGDQIVSSCSTVYVGAGEVEINISTTELYRRRGAATLTAAVFIEHCLSIGLRPNWSCWRERSASVMLARKLGFVDHAEIPVILWPQQG